MGSVLQTLAIKQQNFAIKHHPPRDREFIMNELREIAREITFKSQKPGDDKWMLNPRYATIINEAVEAQTKLRWTAVQNGYIDDATLGKLRDRLTKVGYFDRLNKPGYFESRE